MRLFDYLKEFEIWMDTYTLQTILWMVLCVLGSAFFSASETAFSVMNKTRMKTMAEHGDKKAELAVKLSEQYDKLISTVLIGNNLVNILLTAIATILFVRKFGDAGGPDLRRDFPQDHRQGLSGKLCQIFRPDS